MASYVKVEGGTNEPQNEMKDAIRLNVTSTPTRHRTA